MREELSDEFLNQEDQDGLVLSIRTLVKQNPKAQFINLHGYWTGYAPEIAEQLSQIYGQDLSKELSDHEEIEAEFIDTLQRFIQRQTRAEIENRIRQIAAIPYEELTPELRQEQKQLHNKLRAQ